MPKYWALGAVSTVSIGTPQFMRLRLMVALVSGLASFGALACQPVTEAPADLHDGVYCLVSDVAVSGKPAFRLQDNATLDCKGHKIRDLDGGATLFGVRGLGDNIAVENCVFEGFDLQIWFDEVTHYRIVRNTFLDPREAAIVVNVGNQGLIARNTIRAALDPSLDSVQASIGIVVNGTADVIGNTVTRPLRDPRVDPDASRIGISSEFNNGGVVADNLVRDTVAAAEPGTAMSVSGRAVVLRNVLVAGPGSLQFGLSCMLLTGSFLRNVVLGYANPYFSNCALNQQVGLADGSRQRRPVVKHASSNSTN
jgi:hypothetical protein